MPDPPWLTAQLEQFDDPRERAAASDGSRALLDYDAGARGQGHLIDPDRSGSATLPNGDTDVLRVATNTVIGGTNAADADVTLCNDGDHAPSCER